MIAFGSWSNEAALRSVKMSARRGEEVEKKRKRLTERQKDSKGAALRDRTEKKIERERERERQRMSGMG